MSILIDRSKRVLVQGITGREGKIRARLMIDYGTAVVAGVTPGKGGQVVEGVPVFDTVREAWQAVGHIDVSVLFIPAPLVRSAALEAIASGIKLVVIVPDRVPVYDVLEILHAARLNGAEVVGPNTLGVLCPDKAVLGMMGGRAASAREWFFPGPVGITSRSGGITTSMAYYLARAGIGISTMVHVGGDSVVGLPHAEVLKYFENDPDTKAVVMFGEIGTSQEEEAAALLQRGEFSKPLVAYIGGKAAKSGTRFSHAGAIIEGGRGTYEGKVACLSEAGAIVVDSFAEIPEVTREVLSTIAPGDQQTPVPLTVHPPTKTAPDQADLSWSTAITEIKPNEIRLRGYRIDELMGKVTFGEGIYLTLTGELPPAKVGKLLDAILVASIDHGATPPSALAARTSASTGAPLNAALAAGILSINRFHGGAIEDCMRVIRDVLERHAGKDISLDEAAGELVNDFRARKKRLPGFGHRIHSQDPRTAKLLAEARESGIADAGVAAAGAVEKALADQLKKPLPLNVDGAIAALLVDLHLPVDLANSFFVMARVPGLIAHIYEEQSRFRPMRRIHPTDHQYDGHPARNISTNSAENQPPPPPTL